MATLKLKIHKREFPFKVTPGLKELVKVTYIKMGQVGKPKAKNESKRFAFLACREACKADKIDFAFTYEEFINLVEPGVIEKAGKLAGQMKPKNTPGPGKGKGSGQNQGQPVAEGNSSKPEETKGGQSPEANEPDNPNGQGPDKDKGPQPAGSNDPGSGDEPPGGEKTQNETSGNDKDEKGEQQPK